MQLQQVDVLIWATKIPADAVKRARRRYLKMRNPSVGVWHLEAVHPSCATVQQAKNYRAGGQEWKPSIVT